jgi:hypothetical protein
MNHKPIPPALRASTITVLQSFCDSRAKGGIVQLTIWIIWIKLPVLLAPAGHLGISRIGLWRR